jgi:hypothetical protein
MDKFADRGRRRTNGSAHEPIAPHMNASIGPTYTMEQPIEYSITRYQSKKNYECDECAALSI